VNSPSGALVGTSFGKDSLLTYAVADEIGLEPEMVYVVEQSMTYEQKHKTELARQFKNEFGKQLNILKHETGKLRDYPYLGVPFTEMGWGLQTTEYALELIPFAYALKAKYLLFGNEQTAASTYMDSKGRWTVHPCYDQSHHWTVHIDQITRMFSGRSVKTGSIIEPLMDMMIQYILAHRYPEIAKYQMSCFTETEAGRDYHWCHNCSICAKMYLMCIGSGIDPAKIGLRVNMLERKYKQFFTLFGGKSITMTYAHTKVGRDEQLFAFYLAAKRGAKAGLIEEFKASPLLQEAKDREEELHKTFCTLHTSISVPQELRNKINSIYKEELDDFQC
jgi:7-cyano-7-deazaguanine synthase in queuosine biosynthesis